MWLERYSRYGFRFGFAPFGFWFHDWKPFPRRTRQLLNKIAFCVFRGVLNIAKRQELNYGIIIAQYLKRERDLPSSNVFRVTHW